MVPKRTFADAKTPRGFNDAAGLWRWSGDVGDYERTGERRDAAPTSRATARVCPGGEMMGSHAPRGFYRPRARNTTGCSPVRWTVTVLCVIFSTRKSSYTPPSRTVMPLTTAIRFSGS